jgi:putative acetyltransferase
VRVRPYRDEDAAATFEIYEKAVHQTGAASYTPEQLAAWAPLNRDADGRAEWSRRRAAAETVVAVKADRIFGFSDLVNGTLLDMLFVDPSVGRRGVGSLLIQSVVALARAGGSPYLKTHASLVARPVFARNGFVVISEEKPVIRGVELTLTNFDMRHTLGHD